MKSTMIALLLVGTMVLPGCMSISRQELGIKPGEDSPIFCQRPVLPTYENSKYNREIGANDYLRYAIGALNAYRYDDNNGVFKGFELQALDADWKLQDIKDLPGGLAYRFYFRESSNKLE